MPIVNQKKLLDLENILCCPISRSSLKRIDKTQLKNKITFHHDFGIDWNLLTGFWISKKNKLYYPEIEGVPIVLRDLFFSLNGESLEQARVDIDINPFTYYKENNQIYYQQYAEIMNWKTRFFLTNIRKDDDLIVELLSSDGYTLNALREKYPNKTYLGLDVDFSAAKRMLSKGILAVCADLRFPIFQDNTIDYLFSNSIHHLPNNTKDIFHNSYNALRVNGIYCGIEAHGNLSKLLLKIIGSIPHRILPFILTEIKNEKELLKSWLSVSIEQMLSEAEIKIVEINKTLTHVKYKFIKD